MTLSTPTKDIALFLLAALLLCSGVPAESRAAGLFSSVDVEKPNPEFTRDKNLTTAKFIPRAKSSSVTVQFEVTAGGTLTGVKGVDFATVDRPEVDIKNFKSAAFDIEIGDVTPGGEATVAIRSDFFTLSTAYYIFNPKRPEPWIRDAQSENRLLGDRVRELVVTARDGGELDADGRADGSISLIGGPRDSFWGYALGTLFIRFFGIFIVLTILMIGMIVSGRIFKALDRRSPAKVPGGGAGPATVVAAVPSAGPAPAAPMAVAEAVVAAIAAAIYLEDHPQAEAAAGTVNPAGAGAWAEAGRRRLMNERLMVFGQAGRRQGAFKR